MCDTKSEGYCPNYVMADGSFVCLMGVGWVGVADAKT
jgi:hypothetical protein